MQARLAWAKFFYSSSERVLSNRFFLHFCCTEHASIFCLLFFFLLLADHATNLQNSFSIISSSSSSAAAAAAAATTHTAELHVMQARERNKRTERANWQDNFCSSWITGARALKFNAVQSGNHNFRPLVTTTATTPRGKLGEWKSIDISAF
jgi:hypothetical protein